MNDILVLKVKQMNAFILLFLMVMSSAFVSYDYFNFFKIALLLFSFFVMAKYWDLQALKSERKLLIFSLYCLFMVVVFFRDADNFSYRIVFNLVVTIACSVAAVFIGVYARHISVLLPLVLLFLIYNYFFNINFYDGKPQVHAQAFTLVVLSIVIHGFYRSRLANGFLLLVVLLSKVRSVLLGIFPIIVLNVSGLSSRWRDAANLSIVVFSCFLFYTIYSNFDSLHALFGESLNSMSWRFYHWANLFEDVSFNQIVWGNGLGHSWRVTLFIEDFYTDGENYVAAHSNYVKIIAESGVLGLVAFICLMAYLYRHSDFRIRSLIVFYLGYGFYDEGVWLYSVLWTLLLVSERGIRRD